MNKNKISIELLNEVNSLNSNQTKSVIISTSQFDTLHNFLTANNFKFKPYKFANCFLVECKLNDLVNFSNLNQVELIHSNSYVLTCKQEHDIINLQNLTANKYFGKGVTICFIDTGLTPHFDFIFPYSRFHLNIAFK